ncbi:hypothetical protein JHK82_044628 [Glycine max]|uniref:Uncharacterized protein n=1 Tax=Glycine max TaxID=3847 RepID=A0A0R0FNX7_SOYBN|nr:hypothetical protein JHK86_045029 [Glycine max]KAG4940949.1 hypothetical protein JHK87_044820 [Glycine soja]KAG4951731.1 hypothetical protein JHK85_045598 [Glycine max]KAG5099576.1 hypothetical protein JHK82_044628 [Glycine max]KAG5108178.1 hypothetical protein JHK84_045085 [Glycine max]
MKSKWCTFTKTSMTRKMGWQGTIPTDKGKARKLRTQATRYVMIVGKLYLQGFSSLLLKCLNKEQVDYVIREIHEGICGMHSRGRSMSTGVVRVGYY